MYRWLLFLVCLAEAKNITSMKFQCDDWGRELPFQNDVLQNCSMRVKEQDINEFIFHLKSSDYDWVLFRFYLKFEEREVFKTKCAVEPHIWTWTFPAPYGAYQYLKWPKEYGVWSFGLLDLYSYGLMNITIRVNGTCPVIIGQNETTQRVGVALLDMATKAAHRTTTHKDYQFGSACYLERVFIENDYLYYLCLHIICPIETTGYKCCTAENETNIVCDGNAVRLDDTWWAVPFVIGLVMFAFSPLILINILYQPKHSVVESDNNGHINMHSNIKTGEWLICNPLTFWSIIRNLTFLGGRNLPKTYNILKRISIVLLSISIVVIQVGIHYFYDYHYTLQLVKHHAPLAFRSMAAGYRNSKTNFMPLIGGPYIALSIYLTTTALLVCIPRDLEAFINQGISNSTKLSVSPLTIDIKTKGVLGAVYDLERQYGYQKLYNLMKAHIYMLINPSYWWLTGQMQTRRFLGYLSSLSDRKPILIVASLLLCIPYLLTVCILEWILAWVYYGFPIFLFVRVILTSYYVEIKIKFEEFGNTRSGLRYLLVFCTTGILVFNMYILTVVFVDSFHFITRLMMFTFTGFIAYPGITYGYAVFVVTVIHYVTETIRNIRLSYGDLYSHILKSCRIITKRNKYKNVNVAVTENGIFMISRELFMYVVSRHKPIRTEVLFSVIRLAIITFILFLACHIVISLQRIWDLNPLTQVATALFICLVPKLYRIMFNNNKRLEEMRENLTVWKLALNYCRQKLISNGKGLVNVGAVQEKKETEDFDISVCFTENEYDF